MAGQSIRRSQFITTYGPGALLEGPDGPRVMPTLEQAGIFGTLRINDYEIDEPRLSTNVLGGAKIVSLPSNAQLGREEGAWIYDTFPFPKWSLCVRHSVLYRKRTRDNRACPRCPPLQSSTDAWRRAGSEKSRFIQVCPSGHMQDVDWHAMVSAMGGSCSGSCRPDYFIWEGGGGALRSVNVRCPNCDGAANLGLAYSRSWRCSGEYPEERSSGAPPCLAQAKIVQRGASNVFIPETVTALTIPPAALELHRLLGQRSLRLLFSLHRPGSFAQLETTLRQAEDMGVLSPQTANAILSHPEGEVMRALNDVLRPDDTRTLEEMRLDEYRRLRDAAAEGFPLEPGRSRTQFEVIRSDVRDFEVAGHRLRITPVSRLRVVMVQTGYRRLGGLPVDRRATIDNEHWYPGVELFGEGVFVDPVDSLRNPAAVPCSGNAAREWRRADASSAPWVPDPATQLDPHFVWLHTLSHRLITALSLSCGYSSAALRERIFLDNTSGPPITGGVLLYTAQPGGDGTLGGLVSLVPRFDRVLERAFHDLDSCSNDPLCGREAFSRDRVNGAACYACLFQSETSCEHRNALLDRNVLLGR